ncbi:MAG: TonB-dependent receptor [Altererythrobacter sp.]|nr:TonB-dependent receptor [Altererythrobacter sp.]
MRSLAAFGSLLFLSTALVPPAALAQEAGASETPPATPETIPDSEDSDLEISTPGADFGSEIIVTGRYIPDPVRSTAEVVSVLSSADIARTGEGDIAGALQRVTGLSVVDGGFVYVRGLGERYSLALLNGSPLPSPDPLRRVVPLDIFPTDLIGSSVVQKSYSVNYPGEFGGGVINLTTRSVPREPFFKFGFSVGADSETTGQLGYSYYGSDTDFTGFDDGTRDIPADLQAAIGSGNLVVIGENFSEAQIKDFTASLVNAPTTLIQRLGDIPANVGLDFSGGTSFDVGAMRIGVIAAANYSNSWQTRSGIQQVSGGASAGEDGEEVLRPDVDYRFLSTENRLVASGLLGLGVEVGDHVLRWTNLYIRDTVKEARIQAGTDEINIGTDEINVGNTAWFERQLIDTQFVGEFEFDPVSIDIRGTYANSQRESPYERSISYRYSEAAGDFVNDLRANGQYARIAFSNLDDNVYAGSIDVSYKLPIGIPASLTAGYAYYKNDRAATRRDFRYTPLTALPFLVTQERPDYLLSDYNVYNYDIVIGDVSGSAGAAAYQAELEVHAGYIQAEAEIVPQVRATIGVRYEDGVQSVTPLDLFGLGGGDTIPSLIENDYFLPAATVTWNFLDDMQVRLHASKTIARPQFRELAPQQYQDTDTDRTFIGNQFLTDTTLFNAEARYEWYFGRNDRLSAAGFYKKLDRPIENVAFTQGGTFFTTFANAPSADLYGFEIEAQRSIALDGLNSPIFATRDLVLIGNYTYSQSKIKVGPDDTTIPVGSGGVPAAASDYFVDGTPLTGQSKHLVNLQIGLENTDRLSQQTILVSYASRRVTNRGPSGQPDLIEEPGLRLDFVAREGVSLFGTETELKLEVRNITGENYEEYQILNTSRIDNNTYDLGRTVSVGLAVSF